MADDIADLITNGVFENFDYAEIFVNNELAEIVKGSDEFVDLCWECLKEGLPVPYLPEIFGSDSSFPTMDDIKAGRDIVYLHFAGHLNADLVRFGSPQRRSPSGCQPTLTSELDSSFICGVSLIQARAVAPIVLVALAPVVLALGLVCLQHEE